MEAPERTLSSGKTKPSQIYFKHKRMELSFPRHMLCSSLSHYCGCHLPQHALGRLLPWGTKPSSCPPPPGSHRPAPAAGSPCKHSWQEDTYCIIPSLNSEICPYLTRISMTRESSCHFKTETLGPLLGTSWWLCKRKVVFFLFKSSLIALKSVLCFNKAWKRFPFQFCLLLDFSTHPRSYGFP